MVRGCLKPTEIHPEIWDSVYILSNMIYNFKSFFVFRIKLLFSGYQLQVADQLMNQLIRAWTRATGHYHGFLPLPWFELKYGLRPSQTLFSICHCYGSNKSMDQGIARLILHSFGLLLWSELWYGPRQCQPKWFYLSSQPGNSKDLERLFLGTLILRDFVWDFFVSKLFVIITVAKAYQRNW